MIQLSKVNSLKTSFWQRAILYLFFLWLMAAGAFGLGKKADSSLSLPAPQIAMIGPLSHFKSLPDSRQQFSSTSKFMVSEEGKLLPLQLPIVSSLALKVPDSEISLKLNQLRQTKKVLLAAGTSLVSQNSTSNVAKLTPLLERLENINISGADVVNIDNSYTPLVRTLSRDFKVLFSNISNEFSMYRILRPEQYQAAGGTDSNLSGLVGIRRDRTEYRITKEELKDWIAGDGMRKQLTVFHFGDRFNNKNADQIAEQLQNIILSCQGAYTGLRNLELAVQALPLVQAELRDQVQECVDELTGSRVGSSDFKIYWQPLAQVDWKLAGSFNIRTQDLSFGVGQAGFQKIPKTTAGFVYGADVGPKLSRLTGSSLSYRYTGIEGRVFVGIGVEI